MHWNQKRFPLSLLFTQDFSQVHSHRNLTVSESDHVINMTPYPWFDLIWLISNTLLHKIGSWCTKPSHRAVHLWVVSMHWNRERFPLSLNSCDQNFSHLAAPIETSGCQNLTAVLIWCHHQDSGGSLMTQMVQLRSKKKLSCGEKCISPSPVSSEIFKKKKTKYSFWDLCGPSSPFAFCPHSCVTVNELVSHSCTETFKFVPNY